MNDAVAATKLSANLQLATFIQLDGRRKQSPQFAGMYLPALLPIARASHRTIAILECAHTAIALERFRLKNNRWPESLDEVVAAKLLDKIPDDPYDGKTLRYRKSKDGVVVYSVGQHGLYAGDLLDAGQPYNPETPRYEFRLWDEAQRRQPTRTKAGDKKDGGSL